jgi:hypothetical protein
MAAQDLVASAASRVDAAADKLERLSLGGATNGVARVKLPEFHGSTIENVMNWTKVVELHFLAEDFNDAQKVSTVLTALRREAASYIINWLAEQKVAVTWTNLKKELETRFHTVVARQQAFDRIQNVPFKGNIQGYISDPSALHTAYFATDLDEAVLREIRHRRKRHQRDVDHYRQDAIQRAQETYAREHEQASRSAADFGFEVGDQVFKRVYNRRKLSPYWSGPFTIVGLTPTGLVQLQGSNGNILPGLLNHAQLQLATGPSSYRRHATPRPRPVTPPRSAHRASRATFREV